MLFRELNSRFNKDGSNAQYSALKQKSRELNGHKNQLYDRLNAAKEEADRARRGYEELVGVLDNYRTNLSYFSLEEADADIQ